ncbi:nucleoside-diphosphate-sugar epimerase family protein [Zalerion maritima]|uniref:Nucleoside-diphosphate-sugar epimerase family protein n=1 Tax=Zalerion maritima TaxID=339359 RepID=A0AAD5WVQ2_9PEZI|nr:nucleoside-diphosphate-sugar epimerase family protein [Zalerion maritima]
MAVLLTGGLAAKTSVRIAQFLQEAKIPCLLASRRGDAAASAPNFPAIKFDWVDQTTYASPFAYSFPGGEGIEAVYMIMPRVPQPEKHINAFVDFAAARGVRRFVLMAGTTASLGGPGPGQVWKHMVEKGVEWCVCRPTWFMENLSQDFHFKPLKEEGRIYTCAGDGKISLVSAEDISAVAFHALTDEKPPNTDYRIVGPATMTHDELAEKLAEILGRKITHVNLTPEERTKHLAEQLGYPAPYAGFLAMLEKLAAQGVENYLDDTVLKITGRPPMSIETFAQKHKAIWE